MDDPSSLSLISIFLIITIRLLNNLFMAGFAGLGRISLLAMAERAKEDHNPLWVYLDDPLRLNLAGQAFDKLALSLLALLLFQYAESLVWYDFLWVFLYLSVADLIIPFTIAAFWAEKVVTMTFPLLRYAYLPVYPLTGLMVRIRKLGRQREAEQDDETPEDIVAFLQAGTEEGIIEEKEKHLLHNLITFNDTVVREVMTPRTDMVCIELETPRNEILEVFKQTKFSRLPVYRDDIDHIVGVLRFKDLPELMSKDQSIRDGITNVLFVPEHKNISDQLQDMLKQRLQMAVVIDEFGGTAGLVTLEDLIEEIVGEIHDEHETPESDMIVDMENGSYLVDGKVLLEEFCQLFSIKVENGDVNTVGGFIFNHEGHIPKEGDTCYIGELMVRIAKADERRIYRIIVTPEKSRKPEPELVPIQD